MKNNPHYRLQPHYVYCLVSNLHSKFIPNFPSHLAQYTLVLIYDLHFCLTKSSISSVLHNQSFIFMLTLFHFKHNSRHRNLKQPISCRNITLGTLPHKITPSTSSSDVLIGVFIYTPITCYRYNAKKRYLLILILQIWTDSTYWSTFLFSFSYKRQPHELW